MNDIINNKIKQLKERVEENEGKILELHSKLERKDEEVRNLKKKLKEADERVEAQQLQSDEFNNTVGGTA